MVNALKIDDLKSFLDFKSQYYNNPEFIKEDPIQIPKLYTRKEDIEMDDDNYEYTEEAKDEYVERRMDEVRNDPVGFLRDFGMEESIKDFIDEDEFIEGVIESDGRGHTLSSYDGVENEVSFDDEWYYIYRTN